MISMCGIEVWNFCFFGILVCLISDLLSPSNIGFVDILFGSSKGCS